MFWSRPCQDNELVDTLVGGFFLLTHPMLNELCFLSLVLLNIVLSSHVQLIILWPVILERRHANLSNTGFTLCGELYFWFWVLPSKATHTILHINGEFIQVHKNVSALLFVCIILFLLRSYISAFVCCDWFMFISSFWHCGSWCFCRYSCSACTIYNFKFK